MSCGNETSDQAGLPRPQGPPQGALLKYSRSRMPARLPADARPRERRADPLRDYLGLLVNRQADDANAYARCQRIDEDLTAGDSSQLITG